MRGHRIGRARYALLRRVAVMRKHRGRFTVYRKGLMRTGGITTLVRPKPYKGSNAAKRASRG